MDDEDLNEKCTQESAVLDFDGLVAMRVILSIERYLQHECTGFGLGLLV